MKKSKKQLFSVIGILGILAAAIVYNIYSMEINKHYTCYASKYFFGHNVEKMCKYGGRYCGSNYYVCIMWKNNGQHTIGNEKQGFYTWYMNK